MEKDLEKSLTGGKLEDEPIPLQRHRSNDAFPHSDTVTID